MAMSFLIAILTATMVVPANSAQIPTETPAASPRLEAIDRVWSGHYSRFALVTTQRQILVAYYDANRQLSVATRSRTDGASWVYHRLDSWTGWDSHNFIAAAIDAAGHIHIVANLHNDPLVYYRSDRPGDPRTLVRRATMVDAARERRMTYPVFLTDALGGLVFKYRDGGSGNGNELYNRYDAVTGRWTALLTSPLADGEGRRNAYFVGPTPGPDGRFHLAWVWRETPDAATNHDLSYAVSRDLIHWTRADGSPLALPITLNRAEIVDPVPERGGMINNNTVIGFDRLGRPIITYHKFIADGSTQIFLARFEGSRWRIAQASDWRGFRWDFGGGGSLDSRLFVEGAVPGDPDQLRIRVRRDDKPLDLIVDEAMLTRIAERPASALADRLAPMIQTPPGMILHTVEGDGAAIAWPTRPPRRDMASPDIPEPTTLRLILP
ncbi:BNR repeat-containing protein [Sphingomonas sp. BGYR3]|uniref:BNR repeat-containing protein n=1 Tax=Sphingomonas sp. BGYR3 TaxID=2975483 RepID=UPI0021A71D6D|nr:BNR repeat-containing protein [Sphingomonas sp. BGYR3]MDG5487227.1 BNR repeat-containing protein [Sphingomonas sp. BGYR3]